MMVYTSINALIFNESIRIKSSFGTVNVIIFHVDIQLLNTFNTITCTVTLCFFFYYLFFTLTVNTTQINCLHLHCKLLLLFFSQFFSKFIVLLLENTISAFLLKHFTFNSMSLLLVVSS